MGDPGPRDPPPPPLVFYSWSPPLRTPTIKTTRTASRVKCVKCIAIIYAIITACAFIAILAIGGKGNSGGGILVLMELGLSTYLYNGAAQRLRWKCHLWLWTNKLISIGLITLVGLLSYAVKDELDHGRPVGDIIPYLIICSVMAIGSIYSIIVVWQFILELGSDEGGRGQDPESGVSGGNSSQNRNANGAGARDAFSYSQVAATPQNFA